MSATDFRLPFILSGNVEIKRDVNRVIITITEIRGDQTVTASMNLHPDQASTIELALKRFGNEARVVGNLQNPVHL